MGPREQSRRGQSPPSPCSPLLMQPTVLLAFSIAGMHCYLIYSFSVHWNPQVLLCEVALKEFFQSVHICGIVLIHVQQLALSLA